MYNVAPYIEECIDSVLSQSYQNLEVIIVDDGSTDQSKEIVSRYEDSRIRIVSQNNMGASAARNKGISLATGDYIQFLDADDILDKHKIEEQMKVFNYYEPTSRIAVFGRWKMINQEEGQSTITHSYDFPPDIIVDMMRLSTSTYPHCWLLSKEVIKSVGPWDESYTLNDDGAWFSRVISNVDKLIYCPSALSLYRDTPASLSKIRTRRSLESEMWAYIAIAEIAWRSQITDKADVIYDFLERKANFYYPFYKEYREIAKRWLSFKVPKRKMKQPKTNWKTRFFYLGVKAGLIKYDLLP